MSNTLLVGIAFIINGILSIPSDKLPAIKMRIVQVEAYNNYIKLVFDKASSDQ